MVARIWHGAVRREKADEYFALLRDVGLSDYNRTPGNQASYVLKRNEGDVVHFVLLSIWDSLESIKTYAGNDVDVPRYTDFDADYLIELEPRVAHYSVTYE